MLEDIFTSLYNALNSSVLIAAAAAFGWGVLSILLSPCHLSSIPLIVGYISSQGNISTGRTSVISLVFASGILVTIALIGIITASLGRLMGDIGAYGNYLVALIFFAAGLFLLGIINPVWNTRFPENRGNNGLLSALVLGLLFGLALGPCTFAFMAPVLGVVFKTAEENPVISVTLLASFAAGHCAIITGAGILTSRVRNYLNWSNSSRGMIILRRLCGVLVILGGIYLIYTSRPV